MIVVKTKTTLRVNENGKKRMIPAGAIFRANKIEELPEWLQDHIEYFQNTPRCDTLLIKENLYVDTSVLVETETAGNDKGTLIDDAGKDVSDETVVPPKETGVPDTAVPTPPVVKEEPKKEEPKKEEPKKEEPKKAEPKKAEPKLKKRTSK